MKKQFLFLDLNPELGLVVVVVYLVSLDWFVFVCLLLAFTTNNPPPPSPLEFSLCLLRFEKLLFRL